MAIHRTAKTAAKPAKASETKAPEPAKAPAGKTPAKPRQRKPTVAAAPADKAAPVRTAKAAKSASARVTKAIKTAEGLTPNPSARPRRPKAAVADAPAQTLLSETTSAARDIEPVVEAMPKVAARLVNDTEIRLVQKMDRAATDVEHSVQVYRGIERDGTERLQALVTAYGHLIHGAEEVQQHAWDIVQQSIGSALSIPREFAGCRSFTEIAEKQQDIVQGFFSNWVNASHTMLTASHRVFGRAIRPLELQLSGAEL